MHKDFFFDPARHTLYIYETILRGVLVYISTAVNGYVKEVARCLSQPSLQAQRQKSHPYYGVTV